MAGNLQFWGVEVRAKEPCQVSVNAGSFVHISQATLGEIKKDDEAVTVNLKVGEKKLLLAMLSMKTPQRVFDLVCNEDFEISHNWENGSIHLMGYQSIGPLSESSSSDEEDFTDGDDDSSEEDDDDDSDKEDGSIDRDDGKDNICI